MQPSQRKEELGMCQRFAGTVRRATAGPHRAGHLQGPTVAPPVSSVPRERKRHVERYRDHPSPSGPHPRAPPDPGCRGRRARCPRRGTLHWNHRLDPRRNDARIRLRWRRRFHRNRRIRHGDRHLLDPRRLVLTLAWPPRAPATLPVEGLKARCRCCLCGRICGMNQDMVTAAMGAAGAVVGVRRSLGSLPCALPGVRRQPLSGLVSPRQLAPTLAPSTQHVAWHSGRRMRGS